MLGVTAVFLPLSVPYTGLSCVGMLSGGDCLSAELRKLLPFMVILFESYIVKEESGRPEIFRNEITNDRGSRGDGFSVEGIKKPTFLRSPLELPDTLPS